MRDAIRLALQENRGAAAVGALFEAWAAFFEQHLQHEEKIMMPLTVKTGPTPKDRSRAFAKHLLSVAQDENFDFFVGWTVKYLSRYGSATQPANVATRVWVWGLQHASSAAEWKRWMPIIEANCVASVLQHIASQTNFYGTEDCIEKPHDCKCIVCTKK